MTSRARGTLDFPNILTKPINFERLEGAIKKILEPETASAPAAPSPNGS